MTCRRSQVRVLYRPLEIKNPELRFRFFYFKRHRRGGPFEACTAAQLRRCLRQKQLKQSRGRALVFASARRGARQKSASATRPTCSKNPELRFRVLLLQQRCAERISVRRTAKGPRLFSPGPFALVPVVGVEPTRVISTRDFEFWSMNDTPCHRRVRSAICSPPRISIFILSSFYFLRFRPIIVKRTHPPKTPKRNAKKKVGGIFRRDAQTGPSSALAKNRKGACC